jgi:hypothetical protein
MFCGHADGHPRFFHVDLNTGYVERLGSLVPYGGTGEGWYLDGLGRIYLTDGPHLHRYDLAIGLDEVIFSIEQTHPGCDLWQTHSSDDGSTHSATVRQIVSDGPYPYLGTVVFRNGVQDFYPAQQALDESQVTSDGRFLLIKEGNDNRIISLDRTADYKRITDAEGALGHSDCGPSFAIGEDDQHGACVRWDFDTMRRTELFQTWNMGHVSVRGGKCLLSNATSLALVGLNGSGLTPLIEHGMVSDGSYDTQVFGALDSSGRVATYMSNVAGRLDQYLLIL